MSYTSPSTAVTGGTLTVDMWNVQVRDNLNYLRGYSTALAGTSGTTINATSIYGSVTTTQGSVIATQGSVTSTQGSVAATQGSVSSVHSTVADITGSWTAWTPTLTLNGLTLTYAERTGLYKTVGKLLTATFTIRISAVSGTHAASYDWTLSLPGTSNISTGYRQNVGALSNLHIYPCGYGIAACDATSASQNVLFCLDSTTTAKIRNASHNTSVFSPSPTVANPSCLLTGTLKYLIN